jgi:hypothetical protein
MKAVMEYKAKRILSALIFLITVCMSVSAIDFVSADGGVILMLNADENSAPHPFMPALGASFNILPDDKPLLLEAGMLLFGTQYMWSDERAAPAEIEAANSMLTLGIILEVRVGYIFTLSELFRIGVTGGLASVFRFPIKAYDNGSENQGDVLGYLMARFLYPEIEATFRWRLREKLGLSLGVRYMFPIFHIWDDEDLPIYDQMMFSLILGVQFYFPDKNKENE